MTILKKYWLSLTFLILGLGCLVGYNMIGAYVVENGQLVEPFGLIPLFWLFLLLSIVACLVTRVRNRKSG
ncbi:DUF3955 domain-containing protein [Photobacterium ganghwense]|uniref:DUF3955 domain-containing protein n=1 Tax=Photobacterium ganghwense TaxID=320778 RepID=UPI001C2CE29A|nr:DUF3955 domain-containing protein [Photobacterium ganghwense]MBV1841382.1 DUF3955 domain-containing protein [Photobacterium ganghwense]